MKPNDVRETPPELFAELDARYHFNLDACATHQNALCDTYWTEAGLFGPYGQEKGPLYLLPGDGLTGSWTDATVFCNFPFSDPAAWLNKAWLGGARLAYLLSPATRTEQGWWHEYVEPYRDGKDDSGPMILRTEFLQTRRHFLVDGKPIMRKNKDGSLYLNAEGNAVRSSPKFGLVGLIFTRKEQ